MFKTITTDWVYNSHPLLNNKQRFVGPAWVGWLIVQAEGKHFHPLLLRLVGFLFKLSGAHYDIHDLTEHEIEVKHAAIDFNKSLAQIVYSGQRAHSTRFAGISGIANTNSASEPDARP